MIAPTLTVCENRPEPLEGNYFVAAYPPFACWTEAGLPAVERRLAQERAARPRPPLGLYIHVPFCVERCDFCYYRSFAGEAPAARDLYVESVLTELALYRQCPALANREVEFVYFGGGTPSLLSVGQIERLLRGSQAIFPWNHVREVTFECAPLSAARPKLAALAASGVTRISLGVQQLNDEVLRANGRVHRVGDAERAFAAIAGSGFATINVDLIVGLVGETDETFHVSLARVLQWQPGSVTLYQLEIPRNTPLFRALREGRQPPPAGWDVKRRRLLEAWHHLEQAGYALRSAYTAVRDPARDQFLYQSEQYRGADLLGAGVASFSYLEGVHFQNRPSLEEYQAQLAGNRLPWWRACELSDEEQMTRELVLQWKLGRVESRYFSEKFGVDIGERFAGPLANLESQGLLRREAEGWTLTHAGLARADRLLSDFYLPQHRSHTYW